MLGEQGDIDGAQAAAAEAERLKVQVRRAGVLWHVRISAAGLRLAPVCMIGRPARPSASRHLCPPLLPAVQRSVFEQQAQSRAQSKAGRLGLQNQQVRLGQRAAGWAQGGWLAWQGRAQRVDSFYSAGWL